MKHFSGASLFQKTLIVGAVLAPTLAQAHPGIHTSMSLSAGVAHPLSGLDHLCAMIAVGLWAAQRGGKAIWAFPMAFVSVMTLGAIFGAGAISIPFAEQGLAASVLMLGILIAASVRLPLVASSILVGLFALFHGHAHGAEMPVAASSAMYGLGFIFSTVVLHAIGIGIGLAANRHVMGKMVRCAGCAIALCGAYFLLAV